MHQKTSQKHEKIDCIKTIYNPEDYYIEDNFCPINKTKKTH